MSDHPTDIPVPAPRPVETSDIRTALEAVCGSEDFKRSTRLSDLLRFIVNEEIEGRGGRVKAYSIATRVLGRKSDFDPNNDSIVRVEMARLRIALKLYYASTETAPLVIEVPKGRYRPIFIQQASPVPEQTPPPEGEPQTAQPVAAEAPIVEIRAPAPLRRRAAVWPITIIPSLLFAISAMLAGYLILTKPKQSGERLAPLVLLTPAKLMNGDAQMTALAATLRSVLVSEFATDPVLEVGFIDGMTAPAPRLSENRAVYLLTIFIVSEGSNWSVSANLKDGRTDTVLWSRSENIPAAATRNLAWGYDYSRKLAALISDPFGIVARVELAAKNDERQCMIRLRQARQQWTEDGLSSFVECAARLENNRDSESALALALMARGNYMAARWLGAPDRDQKLELAARQSARALAKDPHLYAAEVSALHVAACRSDDDAVERLVKSFVNRWSKHAGALPEAAYVSAFMLNDMQAADRIMALEREPTAIGQSTELLPGALKAFQQGNMAGVIGALKNATNLPHPAANVLWLIASAGLRDDAGFRSAMKRFSDSGFRTPEAILRIVTHSCWNSQVKAELASALRASLETSLGRAL